MKAVLIGAFLILAGAVAVYLVSSLRNVARESMNTQDLPQGAFEITRWASDANGLAYIMHDPAEQTPLVVSKGLGKIVSEGLRPSQDYSDAIPGKTQAHRIINRKSGQALAYIMAFERIEIETGYNSLKRCVVISLRDPEDSHHRKMQEGP